MGWMVTDSIDNTRLRIIVLCGAHMYRIPLQRLTSQLCGICKSAVEPTFPPSLHSLFNDVVLCHRIIGRPGVYSASNRNEYQKEKNNVSVE
jgi:hypothetical protein